MKNGKKPTLVQKKIIEANGLDSKNWYVVKNTPGSLEIISIQAIRKGSSTTRTIIK